MEGMSELDGLTDGELDGFMDDEGTDECFADGSTKLGLCMEAMQLLDIIGDRWEDITTAMLMPNVILRMNGIRAVQIDNKHI